MQKKARVVGVMLMFVCVVIGLTGCKKEPSKIVFNGEDYFRAKKIKNARFSIVSYLKKGEKIQTAKEFVNFVGADVGKKASPRAIQRVKKMFQIVIKRHDANFKSYKNGLQFCYRQNYRGQWMIVHSAYNLKSKGFKVFQYGKVLKADQKDDDTEDLCENADWIFSQLTAVAKYF
ncbi:MAG TPA: hypothetical protein DCE42_09655 [Myxococcales bacterium]|nr:hypothetical protein [Deltaproteobacteria bacterium]MBU47240.1 hypothetical protein [Deltaproteobacteria bacterium]HAA55012.1 hypothetical protein [Myxococcales bacterium]|tara:strand:- start:1052 stop:1576 length:525 start_codon:yes stop_codon:yes gene_type:complete